MGNLSETLRRDKGRSRERHQTGSTTEGRRVGIRRPPVGDWPSQRRLGMQCGCSSCWGQEGRFGRKSQAVRWGGLWCHAPILKDQFRGSCNCLGSTMDVRRAADAVRLGVHKSTHENVAEVLGWDGRGWENSGTTGRHFTWAAGWRDVPAAVTWKHMGKWGRRGQGTIFITLTLGSMEWFSVFLSNSLLKMFLLHILIDSLAPKSDTTLSSLDRHSQ